MVMGGMRTGDADMVYFKALAGAALVVFGVQTATAEIWVFGDSTVDTGWYETSPFSGTAKFDTYFQNSVALGIGKPTSNPGPISVQTLARLFGFDAAPANQGGTNYATGGARNQDTNDAASGFFTNAVPTDTQIQNYLKNHRPEFRDLFVVSSGGNDVSYALNNPDGTLTDPEAYLVSAAQSLAAAIHLLQDRGARHIMVADLPEGFGTPSEMAYRHLYNTSLKDQLGTLGVDFAWADVNGVRLKIVADPANFNITHTTNAAGDRACTDPPAALGIPSAWAYLCSPQSPVSQPVSSTFANEALFADDEHWATGGQNILGSYYFCLAERSWPAVQHPELLPPGSRRRPPTPCEKFQPIVVTKFGQSAG
jgi:outer membrane lipase/esterase